MSYLTGICGPFKFCSFHFCLKLFLFTLSDVVFQVKTETTTDLNVQHEQKSKSAAEEHERNEEGN